VNVAAAIFKGLVVAGSAVLVYELGRRIGLAPGETAIAAFLWSLVVSLSQDGES